MLSRVWLSFILIPSAVIALGISPPARADEVPAPSEDVSPLEEAHHESQSTNSSDVWQLFYETGRAGSRAAGLSATRTDPTTYGGFTAQQIRSRKLTFEGRQDNLESVYLFVGLQMDLPVTPFAEAGIDFGELLVEMLLDGLEDEDETDQDEPSFVDFYCAVGIQGHLKQRVFFRAYYKLYIIQELDRSTQVLVTGFQLGARF